jgi:hypothetical protein
LAVAAGIVLALGLTGARAGVRPDVPGAERSAAIASTHVAALESWLDANSDYPRRGTRPEIRVITRSAAARLDGAREARFLGRARAYFDPGSDRIYLIAPWNPRDPHDVSVLLHELVHHRQAPGYWYCPQAQEWDAYRLQAEWLEQLGIHPDFSWIAIALESSCVRRDIHPR